MGYLLLLRFQNINPKLEVIFTGIHLQSAKVMESTLTPNLKISLNQEFYIKLDDKNNNTLIDKVLANRLFEWAFDQEGIAISEKDLNDLQYLSFLIDRKQYFICFHVGQYDSCCFMELVPWRDPLPEFLEDYLYIESMFSPGYFEQNICVRFR